MSGTGTIAAVVVVVGATAAVGVARHQGWGAFGEFEQMLPPAEPGNCKPQVLSIGWSTGAGARPVAETRALIKWSKKATVYGQRYASWHNARARDITCRKYIHHQTKCTARGRPCEQQAYRDLDVRF